MTPARHGDLETPPTINSCCHENVNLLFASCVCYLNATTSRAYIQYKVSRAYIQQYSRCGYLLFRAQPYTCRTWPLLYSYNAGFLSASVHILIMLCSCAKKYQVPGTSTYISSSMYSMQRAHKHQEANLLHWFLRYQVILCCCRLMFTVGSGLDTKS